MKKTVYIIVFVSIVLALWFAIDSRYSEAPVTPEPLATSTGVLLPHIYTTRLGETIEVKGHEITAFAVLEDSRCPSDVVCIWAGRATAGLNIESPSGFSTREIAEGESVTTESLKITIQKINPHPVSTKKTQDDEYRFEILVEDHNPGV